MFRTNFYYDYVDCIEGVKHQPLNVSVQYCPEEAGCINTNNLADVVRGTYIKDENDVQCWEHAEVMKYFRKKHNTLIFDHINIDRIMTEVEQTSLIAVYEFMNARLGNTATKNINDLTNPSMADILMQVRAFINVICAIKDGRILKGIPMAVDQIAFLVLKDSEEDIVLSKEAHFMDLLEAPNGILYSLYKL